MKQYIVTILEYHRVRARVWWRFIRFTWNTNEG